MDRSAFAFSNAFEFFLSPVHYSWDPQVRNSAKIITKLSRIVLFTHWKIISLQYFQFLVISGIQTDPITGRILSTVKSTIVECYHNRCMARLYSLAEGKKIKGLDSIQETKILWYTLRDLHGRVWTFKFIQ